MKLYLSLKDISVCLFLLVLVSTTEAAGIDYFSTGINFWNKEEKPAVPKVLEKTKGPEEEARKQEKIGQFDWKTQLDPKNDEFFKEGDYTPPRAFMELARNPSDANIQNWFKLMETKNALAQRLEARIQEYVQKNDTKLESAGKSYLLERTPKVALATEKERFRFRMYFDSKCPHCKRMMSTMEELERQGFFVELRQTDSDDLKVAPKLPVIRATKDELHEKDVKSVPLLLVGDMKQKAVYRITGFQTVESIFQLIQSSRAQAIKAPN